MFKYVALTVIYVGLAVLIYKNSETILAFFSHSGNALWVVLGASLMSLFPVIPYPVVGGVIGAAYGPVMGGVITWAGSSIASILMFLFVRYGYREWAVRAVSRYPRIEALASMFERNAFLAILFARLIPVIPSIIVNVYSALNRVGFGVYVTASLLGKIPAMLLFALIGEGVVRSHSTIVVAVAIYAIFLVVVIGCYRIWNGGSRRRRGD